MSLLEVEVTSEKEILKQKNASVLIGEMNGAFENLIINFKNCMKLVYENQDGLTPQEIFDALGIKGVDVLQISSASKQFINTLKPDTIGDVGYTFEVTSDKVIVTKAGE